MLCVPHSLSNSFIERHSQTVQFAHLKHAVSVAFRIFIDLCIHQHHQFQNMFASPRRHACPLAVPVVSLPCISDTCRLGVSGSRSPSLYSVGSASIPRVSDLSWSSDPCLSGSLLLCLGPWDVPVF